MTRIKDFAAAGSQTSRKRRISEMQGSGGGGVEECDGQGSNATDPEELTALGLNAPLEGFIFAKSPLYFSVARGPLNEQCTNCEGKSSKEPQLGRQGVSQSWLLAIRSGEAYFAASQSPLLNRIFDSVFGMNPTIDGEIW